MMKFYYKSAFEHNKQRNTELIASGCFTYKFVSTLLLMVPQEKLMHFNEQFMGTDHHQQISVYLKYSQSRLLALYSLRNLNHAEPGPNPSGAANQTISKSEMKRIRQQIKQELLNESKLPVLLTEPQPTSHPRNSSGSSTGHRAQGTGHRVPGSNLQSQSNYARPPINLDPKYFNEKTLHVFNLISSNKPPKSLPVLKDHQTNLVPEQLNFTGTENLITHVEIQGNNLKQALIFCQQHKQGCLICLFLLNKIGMKHKIFPHLRSMHDRNAGLLLSNGSMQCPNLLRLSQANRIVALE